MEAAVESRQLWHSPILQGTRKMVSEMIQVKNGNPINTIKDHFIRWLYFESKINHYGPSNIMYIMHLKQ